MVKVVLNWLNGMSTKFLIYTVVKMLLCLNSITYIRANINNQDIENIILNYKIMCYCMNIGS